MTYCRTSILNFYSPILPEIGVLTIKEAEGLLYLFPHLPKSTLPPTMQFVVVAPALLIDSGSLPSLIITTIHVSLLMTLVHSFSPNGISTNGISLGTYWPTAYSSIFSLESCKLQENDSNNGSFAKKWAKPSYPGQTNISPQMNI